MFLYVETFEQTRHFSVNRHDAAGSPGVAEPVLVRRHIAVPARMLMRAFHAFFMAGYR